MIRPIYVKTGLPPNRRMRIVMVQEITARKTFSGRGRKRPHPPRKQGVQRYESGRIVNRDVGESPEAIMSVAVSARAKHHGLKRKDVIADAQAGHLGTVVGRLMKQGLLSPVQKAAAYRYARVLSMRDLIDDVRPAYGIPAAARLASTFGGDPYDNLDPEFAWDVEDARRRLSLIAKIKRDHCDLTRTLWEMQGNAATHGAGAILTAVVMRDDDIVSQNIVAMGTLRCALNVLAKNFGLDNRGA